MRDRITIRSNGNAWVLTIPGFGFSPVTRIEFTKWPDAIDYLDQRPLGSSCSFERAGVDTDSLGLKTGWSPLHWW